MIKRHNKNNQKNNLNDNNSNKVNDSNLDVMDYLIQKLEFRQKKIIKFKNLFKELDSFESFYSQRNEIYLLLNNLEEDLKQATYAIKALLLQNKSLLNDINSKISENKNLSNELNITLGENQSLKLKLDNLTINESKKDEIINFDMNNNNNDIVNVNVESIKVDEEGEFEEPKIKNINLKSNNNLKTNISNYENNNKINHEYNYDQLSNVKNIMKEMRNNKKNLKKIIEEHLREQNKSDKS